MSPPPSSAQRAASRARLAALLLLLGCSLDRLPTHAGDHIATLGVSGAGASGGGASHIAGSDGGNANGGTGALGTAGNGGAGTGGGGTAAADGGGATAGASGTPGTGIVPVMCASSAAKSGQCKATAAGMYALKSELDVWWMDEVNPNQPLTDPGRGKLTIYFMAQIDDICGDGSAAQTTLHTCGARLPALFVDSVCRVIQIEFPDEMWDRTDMPRFNTHASLTGFNPGDIMTINKVTGLLGMQLSDVDAPWPTAHDTPSFACPAGVGVACFPDHDDDGHPGVTVHVNPGGTISNAPYVCGTGGPWQKTAAPLGLGEAAFGLPGAQDIYIGLRMSLGGTGKVGTDCKSGVGGGESSANIPSRVVDCVTETGQPCTATQANFVDSNVPNYHLLQAGESPPPAPTWQHPRENIAIGPKVVLDRSASLGPRTSVVRLGDANAQYGCEAVRSADFAPFQ